MSQIKSSPSPTFKVEKIPVGWIAIIFFILLLGLFALYTSLPSSVAFRSLLVDVFALKAENMTWYVIRSAGITAYLLLWLSTVLGLAIPSKALDRHLPGIFTYDFHQTISLLSLGFLALHVFVLLVDNYLPFNIAQIFVPFLSPFKPVWVGIGVISLYLMVLVTVTFYLRKRIGTQAFRTIHYTSLIGYLGATAHSFFAGTDSALPIARLMYAGSFAVVVFLTAYWLVLLLQKK